MSSMRQFSCAPQRATIRTQENEVNWRKKFLRQYVAPIAPGALDKIDPDALCFVFLQGQKKEMKKHRHGGKETTTKNYGRRDNLPRRAA
jgi:hypothetical protein